MKNFSPAVRYAAPFVVWMGIAQLQGFFEGRPLFWIYGLRIVMTAGVLFYSLKGCAPEIRGKLDRSSVGAGLAVLFFWLLFSIRLIPGSQKASFDPLLFESHTARILAILVRIFGAVVMVPVIEELFWRGFLMRYLISKEFLKVRLGAYSHFSFWVTALAFAFFHSVSDWPAAFLAGIFYGGYLTKTGNFSGCVLAHATTNLGLAVYILITQNWGLWG